MQIEGTESTRKQDSQLFQMNAVAGEVDKNKDHMEPREKESLQGQGKRSQQAKDKNKHRGRG